MVGRGFAGGFQKPDTDTRASTLAIRGFDIRTSTLAMSPRPMFAGRTFGNRHSKPRRCDSGRRDHNGRIGSVGQTLDETSRLRNSHRFPSGALQGFPMPLPACHAPESAPEAHRDTVASVRREPVPSH